MTNDEEKYKANSYTAALKAMWIETGNRSAQLRMNRFSDLNLWQKLTWIAWVEANVDTIPWCKELVLHKVKERLK